MNMRILKTSLSHVECLDENTKIVFNGHDLRLVKWFKFCSQSIVYLVDTFSIKLTNYTSKLEIMFFKYEKCSYMKFMVL